MFKDQPSVHRKIISCVLFVVLGQTGCGGFFKSENDIDSIEISPVCSFVVTGETKQFTATATTVGGETKDVTTESTWSSSSSDVAGIDSQGLLTAQSYGSGIASTTLKATDGDASASTTVTVSATALSTLTLSPSSTTVKLGYTKQITATAKFLDNSTYAVTSRVQWSSSDTSIATVNFSGVVTPIAAGTVTITGTAESDGGYISDSTTVTVSSS